MYVSSRQGYKPPVKSIGKVKEYTHFASLKYCNGAETFYTYDPQRRRLQNLTVNSGGNTIMDNAYTYDANSKYINKKINIPTKRYCSQVTRTYLSNHYSTSSMCAAQTCHSLSCSHSRSRMTCNHAPFRVVHRGCILWWFITKHLNFSHNF